MRSIDTTSAEPGLAVDAGHAGPPALLAATKLLIPEPPVGMIDRPRLLNALAGGVADGNLTLVVGPAGSGKTVLVSSWAAEATMRVAWLTLESTDAEPDRFWEGVSRALRAVGVRGLGSGGRRRAAASADQLINVLAGCEEPVVLVLDDFHEVGGAVDLAVGRLLEHAPHSLRLVILSRRDPVMRLGRLRLAGSVCDLRGSDLACTLDETRAVLDAVGLQLPGEAVYLLWERTEGWTAATRLAATALRASDDPVERIERFSGEDTVISEYLVSELLSGQTDEVHDFLLCTSVVDVLDGHLAEALTGRPGGRDMLLALVRAGLLVSVVDREARWFRYHGLFRELLRAQLRWRDPNRVVELHAIAADWFADHGDEARAVRHAISGQAWDFAGRLAGDRWLDLFSNGELDILAPLADAVPQGEYEHLPSLALAIAATRLEIGELTLGQSAWEGAERATGTAPPGDHGLTAQRSVVELLLSRLTGDRLRAESAARDALEAADRDGMAGDPALRSLVFAHLGTTESWTGLPRDGAEHLRTALALARETDSPWLTFQALAHLAEAEAADGDLAAGQRRAEEAVGLADAHGWKRTRPAGAAYGVLAQIATEQCRFDDAETLIARAEAALGRRADRPARAALAIAKVTVLSARGRPAEGLDVLGAAIDGLGDWPIAAAVRSAFVAWRGRLLAAVGRREAALSTLRAAACPMAISALAALARLEVSASDFTRARETVAPVLDLDAAEMPGSMELWLVEALALDGLLEHTAAAAALERALELGEPAGTLRSIIVNAGSILPLLHRQQRLGTNHPALLNRSIEMIEQRAPATRQAIGILEPLSERERQVLGYMPTTMTNQEIAGALFVSVNTVKTHLRSIYRKLDVDTRRDAVRRARQVRILGSW